MLEIINGSDFDEWTNCHNMCQGWHCFARAPHVFKNLFGNNNFIIDKKSLDLKFVSFWKNIK